MRSPESSAGPDPQPTPETASLAEPERRLLLRLARESIRHGLEHGSALPIDLDGQPEAVRVRRAAFVTLHRGGELRGCIGHLEAVQPLVLDVVENAFAAAFRDPRFPPVTAAELDAVHIDISALTPARPIELGSEADLIARLEPGVDGVILAEGPRRGTFLPSVWQQLPRPEDFLRHLKRKAGLSPDHWSAEMRAWRYRTESFGE